MIVNKRRWIGLLALVVVVALTMAYALWIREVWVGEGADGIGRAAALATIVQAPLVVISVGVAAWQIVQSARAARAQSHEAAALERARTRPYVAVSLDMDREFPNVYLDVQNFGETAAKDVRVIIEPEFVTSLTEESMASRPHDAQFIKGPIGTLVPGQRLTTVADIGPIRDEAKSEGRVLESQFTARVTYRDTGIEGGEPTTYTDEFLLDFDLMVDTTRITRHTVHDLVDRVEKLTEIIEGN